MTLDRVALNRRNRQRGKSTSSELSKYLNGQNVEGMNWPHDAQGPGWRIQSKRDMTGRSPAMIRRLIEAITPGDWLRAVYVVTPRVRLASGRVYVGLREWTDTYGWELPPGAVLLNGGTPLMVIPVSLFREFVVGEAAA